MGGGKASLLVGKQAGINHLFLFHIHVVKEACLLCRVEMKEEKGTDFNFLSQESSPASYSALQSVCCNDGMMELGRLESLTRFSEPMSTCRCQLGEVPIVPS